MLNYFITILTMGIIIGWYLMYKKDKTTGKSLNDKVKENYLWEKELPIIGNVKLGQFNVKLYDLVKNENNDIDVNHEFYLTLLKKISAKYTPKDGEDGLLEFKLIQDKFTKEQLEVFYKELMTLCTNFRFDVFEFKNKEVTILQDSNEMEIIYNHVDFMIQQVLMNVLLRFKLGTLVD